VLLLTPVLQCDQHRRRPLRWRRLSLKEPQNVSFHRSHSPHSSHVASNIRSKSISLRKKGEVIDERGRWWNSVGKAKSCMPWTCSFCDIAARVERMVMWKFQVVIGIHLKIPAQDEGYVMLRPKPVCMYTFNVPRPTHPAICLSDLFSRFPS